MTKPKPKPPPPGRYNFHEIAQRVERAREKAGVEVKDIADATGIGQDNWYSRTGRRKAPFSVEELGRIADYLKAPPYWPFGDWVALEERQRSEQEDKDKGKR